MNKQKILVMIPAYNEEKNITEVIADVRDHFSQADIVVINDGSKDLTSSLAHKEEVAVLDMPFNQGIGAIVQTGYLYALENNYDIAVQVDADGQHRAKELPLMLEEMNRQNADMVIASRFLTHQGYTSTLPRRIGINYFSCLIGLLIKKTITDPTSGFRMVNKRLIALFSKHYAKDYPEPEAIVLAEKLGFRVLEVPTSMRPRIKGKSSITPLKAVYYMIKVTIGIFKIALTQVN